MSAANWFWLFFVLGILLNGLALWPQEGQKFNYRTSGGSFLIIVLIFILGWHAFGGPIK